MSNKVSNTHIDGYIRVQVPILEEHENRKDLVMIFIDNNGIVAEFDTKLVIIDGKKYLEFETSHFSTYAMIEQTVGLPWLWILFSISIIVFILFFIIKRRKEEPDTTQQSS